MNKKKHTNQYAEQKKEFQLILKGEVDILQEEIRQRRWTNNHIQYFAEMFSLMMSILNDTEEDVLTVRMVKYFLDGDNYKDIALLTGVPVLQVMANIRKFGRAFLRANTYKTILEKVNRDQNLVEELKQENDTLRKMYFKLKAQQFNQSILESKNTERAASEIEESLERDFLKSNIENHPLSKRLKNALSSKEILTVGECLQYSAKDLLQFRNMGVTSVNELESFLEKHGYALQPNKKSHHSRQYKNEN